MSTIPKTRKELVNMIENNFAKLEEELDEAGDGVASLICVDDWSVRDLLAVRAWWTENVVKWVEQGRRGKTPVTPAKGYRWRETPRLNADIVEAAKTQSYGTIRGRLKRGVKRTLKLIDELDDRELLQVGAFEWAGKFPISRWLSLNTARQYVTARSFVRKAAAKR